VRILIVDDDEVFLDRMKRILIIDKHNIKTATSGKEALTKLDHNIFDLVFTDLKMPGISGVEFIQKVREKDIKTLIIMITGYGTIKSAVSAMKAGAYDYILKPFDKSTLKNKIKEVETEIELRNDIFSSDYEEKPKFGGFEDQISLNDYESPFLIISDVNPNNIIEKYDIKDVYSIWLGYEDQENSIPPSKLGSIKLVIEEFINQFKKGTIIFKGIEEIMKIHDFEIVKKFILYLQSLIGTLNFSLLILFQEDSEISAHPNDLLLQDMLSILKNPEINKIIGILSHPLRSKIISLLKTENQLNFNKIAKKLDVKQSSLLAFHINKLDQENTFVKKGNLYTLSDRGHYFSKIIAHLESMGYSDPQSKIKLFKISEDFYN